MKNSLPLILLMMALSEKTMVLALFCTLLSLWKMTPIATASKVMLMKTWRVMNTRGPQQSPK